MAQGKLITFEGGEGAGKSTQIRRVADLLTAQSFAPLVTREPGGSPLAEAIRGLILTHEAASDDAITQALLFSAARRDHLLKVIEPALSAGRIVLCDRFADSTRAYQGARGALTDTMLDEIIRLGSGTRSPDLTFLLDLPVAIGLARAQKRRAGRADTFERSALAFHEVVRARFLALAKAEPQRFAVIDASADEESVFATIVAVLRGRQIVT